MQKRDNRQVSGDEILNSASLQLGEISWEPPAHAVVSLHFAQKAM